MITHHESLNRCFSLLTAQEVSARLAIPLPRLYRMVEEGSLPAVKVGRNWRFDKVNLTTWQRTHPIRTRPPGPKPFFPLHLLYAL